MNDGRPELPVKNMDSKFSNYLNIGSQPMTKTF
jgi:hypothetical protein